MQASNLLIKALIWIGSAVLSVMNGGAGAAYNFPVKVRNKDVNAVDEDVPGETNCGSKCRGAFKLKLKHTPKLIK